MAEAAADRMASASATTELAMRRTGMSFQRTRMAADRTLMAVIRTSLSLISFGFTIYQVFRKLQDSGVLSGSTAARNFGVALAVLGIGMLVLGIAYHLAFMLGLRTQREQMRTEGLVYAQSHFPASLVVIVALILLCIGIAAVVSMTLHIGPFG
jgi:putative membrane protein